MQPKRKIEAPGVHSSEATVSLTVKNLPKRLVDELKERAARSHRSLQGEITLILEEAVELGAAGRLTPMQVLERARRRGLKTESSVEFIRSLRDGR